MKITKRQLRKLINETMNKVENPQLDLFNLIKKDHPGAIDSGASDTLSNNWMRLVMRNSRYQETLLHIWDHLIDGDDPAATKQLYLNDLNNDNSIAGAITFYGRKIRQGEVYMSGDEMEQAISVERAERAEAKRNAPPRKPAPKLPYGGGTMYRPYGPST